MVEGSVGNGARMTLTHEKLEQASRIVRSSGVDAWVVLVRETATGSDPVVPLILEGGLTWISALVFTSNGNRHAIVGNYDAEPLIASGQWSTVVSYTEDFRPCFVEVLRNNVPPNGKIAVNYSVSDDKSDGLTHGLWLLLTETLQEAGVQASVVSAEELAQELRSCKTPAEVGLIRDAIAEGDDLFHAISEFAQIGVSERAVFNHVHGLMTQRGLGWAWDKSMDPIVNSGPDSMIGHGLPSDHIALEEGHVFHVDLGVMRFGYCSDVQRCWFVGQYVPDDVQTALAAVNASISAAASALVPGVEGWQVDDAARSTLAQRGYGEYHHATGHQVGRLAHDGGTILGPRWARYGRTPYGHVKPGQVYTLELGVLLPGRGYLGIEEMVLVTDDSCCFLTERQLFMPVLS